VCVCDLGRYAMSATKLRLLLTIFYEGCHP